MARLYSNENFPLPVVEALRELGHDVISSLDAGQANQSIPDDEVLRFAINAERAVLTFNRRHFIRLHAENCDHKGIIACTIDPDFSRQAQRIHDAITETGELAGQLVRVNRPPAADPPT